MKITSNFSPYFNMNLFKLIVNNNNSAFDRKMMLKMKWGLRWWRATEHGVSGGRAAPSDRKALYQYNINTGHLAAHDSDLSRQSPACSRCRPSLWCPPSAPNTSCESLWIHTGGSESPQTNWNKQQQQHDGVKQEVRESRVRCATQSYWEVRANANVHFQVKV